MTREDVASALDKAAEALAEAAHALRASDQPGRVPSAPATQAAGVPPPAPAAVDTGSCPKHGKPFTPSKNPGWAAYCTEFTDDPAWGKPKTDRDGNPVLYCRITDRNAGEWLAVHGRAA